MLLSKLKTNYSDTRGIIDGKILAGLTSELLLIVPTNRKVRSLSKEFIKRSPGQGVTSINIETLSTLSRALLINSGSAFSIPSESAVSVLLEQVFHELANDKDSPPLKYFTNYNGKIPKGNLEKIRSAISEYKRHGVTPGHLREEFKDTSTIEAHKAADLAAVYDLLNSKFTQLKLKDIGDIYSELLGTTTSLHSLFRDLYPEIRIIIIQGFSELTLSEIKLIDSLASIPKMELILELDDNLFNTNIFEDGAIPLVHFENRGFKKIRANLPENNSLKSFIKKNLFGKIVTDKSETDSDSLKLIKAASPEEEITLIAKEIRRLVSEENTPPHSIGVVFNLIADYSQIVRDKFNSFGIPFNLTDRYKLDTFAPVIAVINHLELIENDFYFQSLFRVLSSNYKLLETSPLNDFMKVASELKIVSGYGKWTSALEDRIELMKAEHRTAEITLYISVLKEIKQLNEFLLPFRKEMTLKQFMNRFEDLIRQMNLAYKILRTDNEITEVNLKALSTFLDVVTELVGLLGYEYGENKKFPLKFFIENINTAVSSARFNIMEKSNYGVQVTTFEEIRGLSFNHLFVAGLYDGNIPTRYTPEIFLSQKYAKGEKRHNSEERYLFYRVISSFNRNLYLSYPLNDDKKEFAQSVFLKELLNIISVSGFDSKKLNSYIFSLNELNTKLGTDPTFRSIFLKDSLNDLENFITVDSDRIKNVISAFPEYFGFLGETESEVIRERLKSFESRNYSITQLETYAKCPFKFFVERVLSIKPVEEPTEELESMEIGTLLHKVVDRFYKEIASSGMTLNDCTDDDFKSAESLIFDIAEEEVKQLRLDTESNFFELEKIFGISGDRHNSILYRFLEYERDPSKSDGFSPEIFEAAFGKFSGDDGEQSLLPELKVDNISIRGKIDRIDINRDENLYKVVDYKLSNNKIPSEEITDGISLQLPVYLFAAGEILKTKFPKEKPEPGVAGLYSFKRDTFGFKGLKNSGKSLAKIISSEKDLLIEFNLQIIENGLKFIREYVSSISEGKFNLSTLPDRDTKACKFCKFDKICRKPDSASETEPNGETSAG
ncbi:MAG: PD-(D/E)XK nuclease family protein [Ignavibacteriaceae bacterium]